MNLSIPRKYRQKMYLYEKILVTAYPELFKMPSKGAKGLRLGAPNWQVKGKSLITRSKLGLSKVIPVPGWGLNPSINYINWGEGIRSRPDIKKIVYENVYDLKARNIVDWIDIDNIWKAHQESKENYSAALTIMTSLEMHLKNSE